MLFFYQPEISAGKHFLEDEEYQHCVKVLRKTSGDEIGIFDGKGGKYVVRITEINARKCLFEPRKEVQVPPKSFYHHIAIAPTKNIDRMEWFVEKACELGTDEISFMITRNSERMKLRIDRMEKKALSALKQSKTGYLTRINALRPFEKVVEQNTTDLKYIAVAERDLPYFADRLTPNSHIHTLIGPEGDFTPDETTQALESGYEKISLGRNILRTETAGIVACQFVNAANAY